MKFYPYNKGEGGKCFNHAEGRSPQFFGNFSPGARCFSHNEGSAQKVSTLKKDGGGGANRFTMS